MYVCSFSKRVIPHEMMMPYLKGLALSNSNCKTVPVMRNFPLSCGLRNRILSEQNVMIAIALGCFPGSVGETLLLKTLCTVDTELGRIKRKLALQLPDDLCLFYLKKLCKQLRRKNQQSCGASKPINQSNYCSGKTLPIVIIVAFKPCWHQTTTQLD